MDKSRLLLHNFNVFGVIQIVKFLGVKAAHELSTSNSFGGHGHFNRQALVWFNIPTIDGSTVLLYITPREKSPNILHIAEALGEYYVAVQKASCAKTLA